ncbi:Putative hemolysin [Leminorella richardii]|uniref:Hemolysin n=1 Tax=Leminorella richardii TaxID=158841 RepID=A0A2X4XLI3_9GAMM|nr:DUF333 domain-containing protein [Leminorella richardii]SQI40775.1 Putative hemolysin [Leminorella richardii]
MKGRACLLALSSILLLAGCSSSEPVSSQRSVSHKKMEVTAEPMDAVALANCNSMGGMPTTLHNLDGSAVSKCQLSNGKRF